jgi:hypothetical protein
MEDSRSLSNDEPDLMNLNKRRRVESSGDVFDFATEQGTEEYAPKGSSDFAKVPPSTSSDKISNETVNTGKKLLERQQSHPSSAYFTRATRLRKLLSRVAVTSLSLRSNQNKNAQVNLQQFQRKYLRRTIDVFDGPLTFRRVDADASVNSFSS